MKTAIWYISKYVSPPVASSVGSRGYQLMKQISKKGHDVVIITSDSNALAAVPLLVRTYEIKKDEALKIGWIRTLKYERAKSIKRILSWIDFEIKLLFFPFSKLPEPRTIIVSSLSLVTILNGFLLRCRYGAKLVFEIRDIWPLTIVEEGGFNERNVFVRMLGFVERLGYAKSDLIVGTMPNLEEHVRKLVPDAPRVACIPMGFDSACINKPENLDPVVKSLLPSGKFVVGYAGTIGITNALDPLMECARRMEQCRDIHFVIAGDGDLRTRYQRDYGKLSNITFTGRVPKDQVQSLLAEFDVLFLSTFKSTVWRYGQSLNKLIDYMLAGKPIIASYSGYPTMIDEAECGTFIPAEDVTALEACISKYYSMKREELEEQGKRARDWILAKRSYDTLADEYLALLLEPKQRDVSTLKYV